MELSEDNLDIRKMQCLLDAAQVGWIEKESGGGRCHFSSLLGDALDLSNDTLSQNDFLQLVRTDFRSRVDASVLLSDHGDSKTAIEFPIAVSAGEQWVRCAYAGEHGGKALFSVLLLPKGGEASRRQVNDILQQQKHISRLLFSFLKTKDLKHVCENILKELLKRFHADRAYIFELNESEKYHSCVYEAVAEGTSPQIDMLQKMPLEESPWWSGQILNKRPIILNTLDDLPPQIVQERNILDAQNIRSLMVVPMMSTESVYGYMGIDMVRESRNWSREDYQWFSFLANIISICIGLYYSRKKAERESLYYKELYSHMPIGFLRSRLVRDGSGKVTDCRFEYANQMAEKLIGLACEELAGLRASDILSQEEVNTSLSIIRSTSPEQKLQYKRDRYIERTGVHCKEIDYLSGPDEVITLLKDETETVKANEESKQHERMLDNLFRNIPVGIELYDPEGSLRSINPKDCEIFGVRPDEVLGINIMDNPLVPEQVKEKIRNRQPVDFRLDYRFGLLSDYYNTSFEDRDTRKDIVAKYVPLYDGGNRLLYHLCIVIDNTDTVNIQNRIHDFEHIFSLVADFAKVGYGKYNFDTQTGTAIPQWFRNLGEPVHSSVREVAGRGFRYVHREDRKHMYAFFAAARNRSVDSYQREVRVKGPADRKWRWLRVDMIVNSLADGSTEVIGVNIDITQIKETQQSLIVAKEKAEKMDRLKSAFLANMSHEIRTPLNAIVGFSRMLQSQEAFEKEDREHYMQIVQDNSDLLLQLVSDILDLSKIEAGVFEFNYADVPCNRLCREIVMSLRMKTQPGVELIFDEPAAECVVHSDKNRIAQVLVNFINNAAKFTSKGSIHAGLVPHKNDVEFYVRDTGIGISKEQLGHVFDRFVKLNSFIQGTGLGLPICKSLIEQLGGRIGVESKMGKGSYFWFKLPYKIKKRTIIK